MTPNPAENLVNDIKEIVSTIRQYIHHPVVIEKIDVNYYFEQVRIAVTIQDSLPVGVDQARGLKQLHTEVISRWQADYRLIVTPASLHDYF